MKRKSSYRCQICGDLTFGEDPVCISCFQQQLYNPEQNTITLTFQIETMKPIFSASEDVLQQLTEVNASRCPRFGHEINSWSPLEWTAAVAGEAGELCNAVKKIHRGDQLSIKECADEAADVVIYLDLYCQRHGINLREAIVRKFNEKSQEKGFPERMHSDQVELSELLRLSSKQQSK